MPVGPEAKVERKCRRIAIRNGGRLRKVKLDQVGAPDRLLLRKGHPPVLIEFKAPGKKPKPHQVLVHHELRSYGIEVWVIDSVAEFEQRAGFCLVA